MLDADVPAFWQGLRLPGLIDLHVHFMPRNVMDKVWAYFDAVGERPGFGSPAGVHASCIEFLGDTEAGLLAWDMQDAPIEDQGIPNPIPIAIPLHVHHIVLPYMGMPIVDNCELEELAVICNDYGRWEFQFVVAPLVITRGTGSPVTPLAIF